MKIDNKQKKKKVTNTVLFKSRFVATFVVDPDAYFYFIQ